MKSDNSRSFAIDALRGTIIVLMALDHANYFIAQKHPPGEHWGGSFPVYSDALTFMTRWVTHPVAPGFAFLMGIGMMLYAHSRRKAGWREWEIVRHFFIRGLLLIMLQLLIVNRAWQLGPSPFPTVYLGVLFALGGGMILGSFLLRLGAWPLMAIAAALFLGIELLHPDPSQWGLIFEARAGLILAYSGGDLAFWSNYPILPWLELIVFGMAFGGWLIKDSEQAYDWGLLLGTVFLLSFVALRALDGFGNIRPRMGDGWIDFLNVVKYPPAMTFTLVTMSLNLILLWLLSKARDGVRKVLRPLVIFGRAPLFFYITHLFLYSLLGMWLAPNGSSIPAMLPYWLLGLAILLPPALLYGVFKQRQRPDSLLRLF